MPKKYDTITIKKYANRRLYDTSKSSYITLNDISEMVQEGLDFVVVDAKTGEDLTHAVLAQIVLDQESEKPVMFPTEFMRKIISMYGGNMQGFVPNFLGAAMDNLMANQEKFQEQMSQSMDGIFPNMGHLNEMNRRNMEMIENTMQMFNPFQTPSSHVQGTNEKDKDARIAELEAEIKNLKSELKKQA
tara:strand:- start:488 stop:1051 length:564 start_codon:yes stop_codon:yes gene_type:complete